MRRTLTIDDDVDALLERANRRANEPMKQTINRALRSGLKTLSNPEPRKRFIVKPFNLGPVAERFRGMIPTEIDAQLEIEHYLESCERA